VDNFSYLIDPANVDKTAISLTIFFSKQLYYTGWLLSQNYYKLEQNFTISKTFLYGLKLVVFMKEKVF
jgi:hypothetical protein